jgi:hypothetical protein
MTKDTTYNGWTNYETWAVKLWMDNDRGSYNYWREAIEEAWFSTADKHPNEFMDRSSNARTLLADRLKDEHDSQSDHPVFEAANGTVYADLLNAALSEVDWREIANSLLESAEEDDRITGYTGKARV